MRMEVSNPNSQESFGIEKEATINQYKIRITVKKKTLINNKDNKKAEEAILKIKDRIQEINNKFPNNDNIIKYHNDIIVGKGKLSFTMELCDKNLFQYFKEFCPSEGQGLNAEQIYNILDQLNNAFRIFESDNIIHGNIKLENILVKKKEENYIFKLSGFEFIPDLINATKTYKLDNMCIYLPPEILENKNNCKIDQKTDLWSLGVIIYYLCFKEFPYNGGTCEAVLEQIKNNIRKKTNNSELDDLIDGLLNTNKEERFDWYKYLHHEFFPWRNKYELGESLGGESCYEIYKVREYLTDSEKVIKIIKKEKIKSLYRKKNGNVIKESEMEEFVKLLIEQTKKMKMLENNNNNKNTVKFFEYFDSKTDFAVVMEKCDTDLNHIFNNSFSLEEIKELLNQLNNTFKIMLKNEIMHGDLKLENILTKTDNNNLIYKLTDYGISKKFFEMNRRLMGWGPAPEYSAPEILSGKDYNSSCDLWSLGIILYTLYFKTKPYEGNHYYEVLNDINKKGQLNLHQLSGDDNFGHLIRRLLTFDPKDRITWKEYFEHPFLKGETCWKFYEKENKKSLGEGDYYDIYKVKSKITGEYKAIKVINLRQIRTLFKGKHSGRDCTDEDLKAYIDDFIEEFKISELRRGSDRENIYTLIYEQYFQTKDQFCIVEELCDGDLLKLKIEKGRFEAKEIYQIFNQLNNTFKIFKTIQDYNQYVRDLKLEEILYKKDINGGGNIYKISNFSSNKKINELLTSGGLIPNYKYKAPEILEILYNPEKSKSSGDLNSLYQKAYLWNLGIIIFLLYFGDFPYEGESPKEIHDKIMVDEKNKLNEIIDSELKDLLKKLLTDRDERIDWNDYFHHKFFSEDKWKQL